MIKTKKILLKKTFHKNTISLTPTQLASLRNGFYGGIKITVDLTSKSNEIATINEVVIINNINSIVANAKQLPQKNGGLTPYYVAKFR